MTGEGGGGEGGDHSEVKEGEVRYGVEEGDLFVRKREGRLDRYARGAVVYCCDAVLFEARDWGTEILRRHLEGYHKPVTRYCGSPESTTTTAVKGYAGRGVSWLL
jgi:hypothetical protein